MKKRGAKLKLSKKMIDKAVQLVTAGNYTETVCQYLGIGTTTWYRWIQEGESLKEEDRILTKDEELKVEFVDSLKKASSMAEIKAVDGILTAGEQNWTAYAWFLERKYNERWGKKEKIEHSGRIDGEQTINLKHLSDKELEEELKKLEE